MDCFNNENNIAQEILNRVVQRIMSIITFKLQLLARSSCKWVAMYRSGVQIKGKRQCFIGLFYWQL